MTLQNWNAYGILRGGEGVGGCVLQTSLAYELCYRNLVHKLRLPLSLHKIMSKQVSELYL